MKTYREVIDETVEYYKNNPFGFDGENCVYYGDNGEMCAVGRCLINPEEFKYSSDLGIRGIINDNGMSNFREEYRHLDSIDFWQILQYYHDNLAKGEEINAQQYYSLLITKYGDK